MATSYSGNLYRIASLLVDVSTEVLRKRFVQFVLASPFNTLPNFFYSNQHTLFQLQKNRILRKDQLVLLNPPHGQAPDPGAWDISLVCVLLKNLCSLPPQEMIAVDSLRVSRNSVYGHIGQAALTDAEFHNHWNTIETAILDLCSVCKDQTFEDHIKAWMVKVKEGPLELGSSVKVLLDWYRQDKLIESRLVSVQDKLEDLTKEVKERASRKPKTVDHVFTNLQNQTGSLLQEKCQQPFVRCRQFLDARQTLEREEVVAISGKPGEGKTLAALMLLQEMADVERCLVIYSPSQLAHVDADDVDVLLIDDMLGKHQLDVGKLREWQPLLDTLQRYVTSGQLKLIITNRTNVLTACAAQLEDYRLFRHKVEFSSDEMSVDEKRDILKQLLLWYKRDVNQCDVGRCCDRFKAPLGFPYCAFLFAANEDLFAKKESFFKRPLEFFKEAIGSLDKDKMVALLLIFYKQNALDESELRVSRKDTESEIASLLTHVASLLGAKPSLVTMPTVAKCIKQLQGIYISHIGKTYSFAHNTIYECVTLMHAENYPEEVIEHCSSDFFDECVSTEDSGVQGTILVVECDCFDSLATRIVTEVTIGQRTMSVVRHPSLRDAQVCRCLIEQTKLGNKLEALMTTSMGQTAFGKDHGAGLLRHYVEKNAESETLYLINEALPEVSCDRGCFSGTDNRCWVEPASGKCCWKCEVKHDALCGACRAGRVDIFTFIHESGVSVSAMNLSDAAKGGNAALVQKVVSSLKLTGTFDPDAVHTSKALVEARKRSDLSMYRDLLAQGAELTSVCLVDFVRDGNIAAVRETVTSLKAEGHWNPTDIWIQNSMTVCLTERKTEIYEYLKAEGVEVGNTSLLGAVQRGDLELVKGVVSHMKATGVWKTSDDKLSVDAILSQVRNPDLNAPPPDLTEFKKGPVFCTLAEALVVSRRREDNAIYSYMLSEGVKLTMDTLRWSIAMRDVDFVNAVIEDLKDAGAWKADSREAGRALVEAMQKNYPGIVTLLQNAGVTLSMNNLSDLTWETNNQELIEEVLNILVVSGKWDPTNIVIEPLLLDCYKLPDKTLLNLLLSYGASVSVKTLVVPTMLGDLKSLSMLLEIMKASPSWNPADPLLVSVTTIAKAMHPAAHALLVQAGVGWCTENYLAAARSNSNVNIMMAINSLIGEGKWNPENEPNIRAGLETLCLNGNIMMYNISVKKGAIVSEDCLYYTIRTRTPKSYFVSKDTIGEPLKVPTLVAMCTAHLSQYCFEHVSGKCMVTLWKMILALVECGVWRPQAEYAVRALQRSFETGNVMLYNTLLEAGVPVALQTLYCLIDSVTRELRQESPNTLLHQTLAIAVDQCLINSVKNKENDILQACIKKATSHSIWHPDKSKLHANIQNALNESESLETDTGGTSESDTQGENLTIPTGTESENGRQSETDAKPAESTY